MNRGRPREFDKSQALEAAMETFWERGYEGTGLSDLEACTGLGRQSLYNAFGDKRALFDDALRHYQDTYFEPMLKQLAAPGSPIENIKTVLSWWEERAKRRTLRGCLVANSLAEFGMRGQDQPGLTDELSRTLSRLEKGFHGALRRAQAEGELSAAHDPKALARLLTTLAQGLSVVHKVTTPAFSRDAIRAVRMVLM